MVRLANVDMVTVVVGVGVEEDVVHTLGKVKQQERGQRGPASLHARLAVVIVSKRREAEGRYQSNTRHAALILPL